MLRSIRRREVTLEKDRETMIIALPVPGQQAPTNSVGGDPL
jgi:hypothetical protein